eukprot:9301320-Alexandrium_andersonii.AAC.1
MAAIGEPPPRTLALSGSPDPGGPLPALPPGALPWAPPDGYQLGSAERDEGPPLQLAHRLFPFILHNRGI